MVYIYKKQIGDRAYYYLRASERKNNKVITKDIAYLGNNIEEIKKKLESLPKYSEQIRKAYKTINNFLESNRYLEKVKTLKLKKELLLDEKLNEIESCKLHYNTEFRKNQELTQKEIFKNFIIEFSFNTTAIEGNTIKLEEARRLLEEGITPRNKTLREIYDVQNTEETFFNLINEKKDISHELIMEIHKNLMKNIDVRIGYRTTDVRVIKANFKASPAPYVKTDMDLLLKWHIQNKDKFHTLVLATIFHHKFEKIHPFMDGNGRTGRMLLNFILMRNNYPPIIIHTKKRSEYLKALRIADKTNLFKTDKKDYLPLINFIAEETTESYWNIFL